MHYRQRRQKQIFWTITGVLCVYVIILGFVIAFMSLSEASEPDKTVREGYHQGWKTRVVREPSKAQKGTYTERGWHNGEYINVRESQKKLPTGKGIKDSKPENNGG